MRRHRGWVRIGLIVTLALFILPSDLRPLDAAERRARWSAGRPSVYSMLYNDGPGSVAEAHRRRMVVLNAWEWSYIDQIRAKNPEALVLVYKDFSSTRNAAPCSSSQDDIPTGVDYCFADQNHPDWFLTDSEGHRLEYKGFAHHWQMDVGNPDYQREWINNVRASLEARGWDGVFGDNALIRADDYHPGVRTTKFPTNESIQGAYESFLTRIGNSFSRFVMANVTDARLFPGLWKRYMAHIDGGFDEWWIDWSKEPNSTYAWDSGPNGWIAQVREITDLESDGKIVAVHSGKLEPTVDTEGFKYTLGSYLLANGGRTMFIFGMEETWHPAFDWNLGDPTGAFRSLGKSVYRRDFSSGAVIVNASQSTVTIPLDRPYRNEDDAVVDSVVLGPQRATILRNS